MSLSLSISLSLPISMSCLCLTAFLCFSLYLSLSIYLSLSLSISLSLSRNSVSLSIRESLNGGLPNGSLGHLSARVTESGLKPPFESPHSGLSPSISSPCAVLWSHGFLVLQRDASLCVCFSVASSAVHSSQRRLGTSILVKNCISVPYKYFLELISRKLYYTCLFAIQRITWKFCLGIISLQNPISVT